MNAVQKITSKGIFSRFADRFSVASDQVVDVLKATAFRQRDGSAPTDAQMTALLVVADQYQLNPFTREIYAFPDKNGGITPVVGVDGWSRIINSHAVFDGMEFHYSDAMTTPQGALSPCYEWVECAMHRKDRSRPVVAREYLDEVYRPSKKYPGPWQTHPKRFLRHKAMIQTARIAFGFVGIFDPDEAERINESIEPRNVTPEPEKIENYPAELFDKNFEAWKALIQAGKKSPDRIIAMVQSKGDLTKDQKQAIENCAVIEGEIT